MKNCVDIVRPFALEAGAEHDIQIFGGVGSAALEHPDTVILPDEKRIVAPEGLELPQFRSDDTRRDLDALVLTTDSSRIEEVRQMAQTIVGDELKISIFGLRPATLLEQQIRHPLSKKSLRTALADRYATEGADGIQDAWKALFPFSVPIHPETLQTWQLFIGDKDKHPMPVPHPGTTILNYLTRSVGGLRPKDEGKVHEMATHIARKSPETRDWIMDGPGRSQIHLARIINKMGRKGKKIETRVAEVDDYRGNLAKDPAFMIGEASLATKQAVLLFSRRKARLVHIGESMESLVTLWQRHDMEDRVESIVYNE
ncbi:MAG TPA: hypothetical protein VG964_04025 [Candidatus Saccharimonadales bacterium]|nr:hypothetical protein [Candidatus Saccharimonadales bacterium]